jgi:hypothetical protein
MGQFALWFHQDFSLVFPGLDIVGGARMYLKQLTASQTQALQGELAAFLNEHSEQPPAVLTRLWMKQGVQYWPRGSDTMGTLQLFVSMLDEQLGSSENAPNLRWSGP